MSADQFRDTGKRAWPFAVRVVVSIVIGFHCLAMVAIALAGSPASDLERRFASLFGFYAELTALGSVHRYYAPAPPPTPVLTVELRNTDGAVRNLRIPDRNTRPRLRYQRQLALAHHLYVDVHRGSDEHGHTGAISWPVSYARHLLAVHPDAEHVVIRAQQHFVPDLTQLAELSRAGQTIDLDHPSFFTVPEVVAELRRSREP